MNKATEHFDGNSFGGCLCKHSRFGTESAAAKSSFADAVLVGSALVSITAEHRNSPRAVHHKNFNTASSMRNVLDMAKQTV